MPADVVRSSAEDTLEIRGARRVGQKLVPTTVTPRRRHYCDSRKGG